jgi:hypothetical protein
MYHAGAIAVLDITTRRGVSAEMINEMLHEAAFEDRQRSLERSLRHREHHAPRRGLLARWRAHRAGRSLVLTATPAPAAVPARVVERDPGSTAADAA